MFNTNSCKCNTPKNVFDISFIHVKGKDRTCININMYIKLHKFIVFQVEDRIIEI